MRSGLTRERGTWEEEDGVMVWIGRAEDRRWRGILFRLWTVPKVVVTAATRPERSGIRVVRPDPAVIVVSAGTVTSLASTPATTPHASVLLPTSTFSPSPIIISLGFDSIDLSFFVCVSAFGFCETLLFLSLSLSLSVCVDARQSRNGCGVWC